KEVACHPVVLGSGGDVLDLLTKIATQNLGAARAGRADEGDRETRVISRRDQRRFSVAGQPFDANLFGVDSLVAHEIVQRAARCASDRRFFRASQTSGRNPNSIMTGTGPLDFAGVASVN